jgi:hypothetical protein
MIFPTSDIDREIRETQQKVNSLRWQLESAEAQLKSLIKRKSNIEEDILKFEETYGFKPILDNLLPSSVISREINHGWGVTKFKYILYLRGNPIDSFVSTTKPYRTGVTNINAKYEGVTLQIEEEREITEGMNGCGMGNEHTYTWWQRINLDRV